MKESTPFPFKKETKEDVRAAVERDINRLKHKVEEARYQLNGILASIDAQNEKVQDEYRNNSSSEINPEALAVFVPLQERRDELERIIFEKESTITQLRAALKEAENKNN